MNMKIMIIGILVILFAVQTVHAAGILWNTEILSMQEGETKCATYGVYNPFETDMKASFSLDGGIKDIADFKFEETTVMARTYHQDALPVDVCFTVKKVYKEDCMLGPILCEKTCTEPRVSFTGDVVVTDSPVDKSGGTGSKAVVSASAPLTVDVLCTPHDRDYSPLFVITIVIAIAVVASMLFRKYRTPAVVRKERKLVKLQADLDKEKKKSKK